MVPAELVEAIASASLQGMREWHEANDFPVEPMVCAAAMSIAEKMVLEILSGPEDETVQ